MDRRTRERARLWLPVEVAELDAGVAVSHDASETGLLLVASSELAVGARLHIAFRVPPEAGARVEVEVEVVRVSANDEDPHGLWPFKIAVHFVQPVTLLERYLREVSPR